jgi:septum site-determining protein MinD
LLSSDATVPGRAYLDAAKRLNGEKVPITIPSVKKGIFRLFARRAA